MHRIAKPFAVAVPLMLAVAGCAFPPYVGGTDPESRQVAVCYNGLTSTPAEVIHLAAGECALAGAGSPVFQRQESGLCALSHPSVVYFRCGGGRTTAAGAASTSSYRAGYRSGGAGSKPYTAYGAASGGKTTPAADGKAPASTGGIKLDAGTGGAYGGYWPQAYPSLNR